MIPKAIPYRYTKTELEELLDSIVILIDTREKENKHITDYLGKQGVKFKTKKLDYGDYSFMIPANKQHGIFKDIYFNEQLVIERKASLEELSNNMTHERQRFENELIRKGSCRFILLIENQNGYRDIVNHNYRTQYNERSYLAGLMSFQHRYNIVINFIDRSLAGNFIRWEFYYYLREYLK